MVLAAVITEEPHEYWVCGKRRLQSYAQQRFAGEAIWRLDPAAPAGLHQVLDWSAYFVFLARVTSIGARFGGTARAATRQRNQQIYPQGKERFVRKGFTTDSKKPHEGLPLSPYAGWLHQWHFSR